MIEEVEIKVFLFPSKIESISQKGCSLSGRFMWLTQRELLG